MSLMDEFLYRRGKKVVNVGSHMTNVLNPLQSNYETKILNHHQDV